jgi:peptide/nickel transport system permease protein
MRRSFARFLIARAFACLVLIFAASSAMQLLVSLAPGDEATELVTAATSGDAIAAERARLGLDRPLSQRYASWARRALLFDFGVSTRYHRPVLALVAERAANTALIALVALALALMIGLPLGIVSGSGLWPRMSAAIGGLSLVALSLPPLLTSLLLAFAAARTGWLPVGSMADAGADALPLAERGLDALAHLVLPVTALALPLTAALERLQADAVIQVRRQRHVLAARARGVTTPRLLWRALGRPALVPLVGVLGLAAGSLLSGSFAVEIVTAWPGLGRLMFEAVGARDVPLAAGCGAAAAAALALWTTAADLASRWLDPRLAGDA